MRWTRVRFTVRRMMIVIAVIGFVMFEVRWLVFANTVFSARYHESRFQQIRVGMTSAEVEAMMGPPLRKVPVWPDQELVWWVYTDSRPGTSGHFWRRDVLVDDDRIVNILNDYVGPD